MKFIKFLILITFITSISFSQTKDKIVLSGNLSADAKVVFNNYSEPVAPQFMYSVENKKSPILAGVMSLLIPGSGEIYAGEYLKAGIFIALEAAVVTTAIVYDGKGDDKTTEFQNYADDYTNDDPITGHNWDVVKYAEWLATYEGADLTKIIKPDVPEDAPPWDRVNWDELNAAEKGTHKLPPHGDQQYYELIGKYPQFSPGWNDFNSTDYHDISENFLFYSVMRGEANDFYSVASTAVIGIYVNHFLSALDAVWSTAQFNKDLAVKVRLENIQLTNRTEYYPKIYFTYSF